MRSRAILLAVAAAVAVVACAGVLGLRKTPAPVFAHRAHVTAGIGCPRCHTGIEAAGDDATLHIPDDASCQAAGCHDNPHDKRSCASCHSDPFTVGLAIEAKAHLKFAHNRHATPAVGNCARCHQAVGTADGALRPVMATCWSCHERERDVRDCNACHVDLADEATPPASHLIHDDDYVTRHGPQAAAAADACASCHRTDFCASCHGVTAPTLGARLRPADPMAASAHRPGFVARHGEAARAMPGTCTTCHAPDRCLDCHRERGVMTATTTSPHPPGWIGVGPGANAHGAAARRDPVACASCHGGAGEQLCVGCHKVGGAGGNPHPPGWSSQQPLTAMPCRMCHPIGSVR
jgi:hypothetical protein